MSHLMIIKEHHNKIREQTLAHYIKRKIRKEVIVIGNSVSDM